jgi:RNA polymerase sigma-70 factor, ECF subfamily
VIKIKQHNNNVRQIIGIAAREHHGQILAVLIRDLRDFQLAEDCLQDALESALTHWQRTGPPHSPKAWLLQVARRKALDRLRRAKNFKNKSTEIAMLMECDQKSTTEGDDVTIPDERLCLIFTCCHPALDPATSVALSLRTLCGLATSEIARAFVVSEETMAQRLVRARQKIMKAGIAYEVPEKSDLPHRMHAVLSTLYLMFNEGYAATSGRDHVRVDICEEAIRLAQVTHSLCPHTPEVAGLLAPLMLTHARRNARKSVSESYIPLEEQDRSLWDHELISKGEILLVETLKFGAVGPYQLQAAISAVHAGAKSHPETDWGEIALLYGKLYELSENPVYRLNRAVALSFISNPNNALIELDKISSELPSYQPYHAARADILRRNQNYPEARLAYDKAIVLSKNEAERDFLTRKRASLFS